MTQTLFTTQVPEGTDFNESLGVTLATSVYFTAPGKVVGGRFYAPVNPNGTYEIVLFKATQEDYPPGSGAGVQITSIPLTNLTGGAWNSVLFSSPVDITVNEIYKIAVRTSAGSYTATNNFFGSPLINEDIVGPESITFNVDVGGSYYNGSYVTNLIDYPNNSYNASCYFVDILFEPSSIPTGLALSVWSGVTEVPATLSVWNGSVEVPAQVPEIST